MTFFSGEFERLSRIHQFGFKSWGEILMFVVQLPILNLFLLVSMEISLIGLARDTSIREGVKVEKN